MNNFFTQPNYALVTAILPRQSTHNVVENLLDGNDRNLLLISARGTLVRPHWYQTFLPVMNPEQDIVQMLVPESETDYVLQKIATLGRLKLAGAGAIYSITCNEVTYSDSYPMWPTSEEKTHLHEKALISFRENLKGIFCITEGTMTEAISKAAIQTGAHGPSISLCEGRGLRDRHLLLRIAKSAEKELIQLVVDDCDAEPVFNAMANGGRIDEPGRGFIFRAPIEKGLINVASVYGHARHSASAQQIINAIDDLKGGTDWRTQEVLDVTSDSTMFGGIGFGGKLKNRHYLTDQTMLTCICTRNQCDPLIDAALNGGVNGLSISYGRFIEAEARTTRTGARIHRERAIIQTVLPPRMIEGVREAMKEAAIDHGVPEVCFYTFPVAKGLTYTGK